MGGNTIVAARADSSGQEARRETGSQGKLVDFKDLLRLEANGRRLSLLRRPVSWAFTESIAVRPMRRCR
jgi:hypothetical protein